MRSVHTLDYHFHRWHRWVDRHSESELDQKDDASISHMRALRPAISAFFEAAISNGCVSLKDQPIVIDALDFWEDVGFITRFGVLSLLSEIYTVVLERRVEVANAVLVDFALRVQSPDMAELLEGNPLAVAGTSSYLLC